jgi:hypothetical protein
MRLEDLPAQSWIVADAGRGGRGAGAGGGTGAAVPQPPGLCAGDALPGLRGAGSDAITATRGWWSTGSSSASSATSAARPSPCPRPARSAGWRARWPPSAPAWSAWRRRPWRPFPRREDRGPVLGPLRLGPRAQGPDRGDRGGRHRHHHRHAAGGEGAQLPAPDAGGRGRCRSRPAGRRPARGGAHVSADAAGLGPRGAGGQAGRRAFADLSARASGDPRHPRGDEEAFWRAEAAEREAAGMPPYGRLAGIIISAGDAASAFDLGQHLARNDEAIRAAGGVVYGPAPAPIARVRGRHRVRLLVKAPKGAPLQAAISRWIGGIEAAVAGAARGGYRPAELLLIGGLNRAGVCKPPRPSKTPSHVNECTARHVRFDHARSRDPRHRALPGWREQAAGFVAPLKLSSNENPFGPPPSAVSAMAEAATMAHRYPSTDHKGCGRRCPRSRSRPRADHLRGRVGRDHHASVPGLCRAGGRGALSRARVRDVPHLGAGGGGDAGDRAGKGACRRYRGDP